jgi:hypothetical protein
MQPSYPDFRKRLDAVLRQRDPAALRAFLIAEGQWDAETATDPERAMWMMIATSPALAPLHADAIAWLGQHGYQEEAQTLAGRRDSTGHPPRRPDGGPRRRPPPSGPHRPPHRHHDRT